MWGNDNVVNMWKKVISAYSKTKSIRGAAAVTGVSKSGVGYILKKSKVKLFPRTRKGDESSSRKSIPTNPRDPRRLIRTKEYMEDLYANKKMSIPEIAKYIGISRTTVITGLNQCGIQLRTKSESLLGKTKPGTRGANSKNWRGGATHWGKLCRHRLKPIFVLPVMKRDLYTCQNCGSVENLTVHHLRSFSKIVNLVRERHPTVSEQKLIDLIVLEHSIDDGITWCKRCHIEHHRIYGV